MGSFLFMSNRTLEKNSFGAAASEPPRSETFPARGKQYKYKYKVHEKKRFFKR